MNFLESFRIALDMLRLHKMRAFLTMLGVIIGVMAVSLVVLISSAFQDYLAFQFAKIGTDTIFVSYEPSRLERGKSSGDIDQLTLGDIDFIKNRTQGKIEVASGFRGGGAQTVKNQTDELKNVQVQAIDEYFMELNNVELMRGRYFNDEDSRLKSNVALISEDVEKELFKGQDALGKLIQLPGLTLTVVGITKPLEMMGSRNTQTLFLPLSTANSKWMGDERVDLILMKAKKGEDIDATMDQIWRALMVKSGNRELYSVDSSKNVLNVFQNIVRVMGLVLSAIAALSLLVGGIGIMNIMLVSVTERTREIGLRKAVGAKRPAILFQFLIEAATLSLVGGLIGMGIAYGFGLLITIVTKATKWPNEGGLTAPFPIPQALAAMAFSALIGCVFGFFPAFRASQLDPIVALRSE